MKAKEIPIFNQLVEEKVSYPIFPLSPFHPATRIERSWVTDSSNIDVVVQEFANALDQTGRMTGVIQVRAAKFDPDPAGVYDVVNFETLDGIPISMKIEHLSVPVETTRLTARVDARKTPGM